MGILTFLLSPLGRLIAGALAIGVFVSAFAFDQQRRGAAKAVAKIEKATTHAVNKADAAGTKSRSLAARGVRDPHSLD